jgi:hypothetical protein
MLVKDEALQARHARQTAHAAYADRVNAYTMNELGRARIMESDDLAPNNPERQMGRLLTPHEFETRIVARLGVPNLLFEVHPTNPNKRCMYQVRGGEKCLICVYEANTMPEFSIVMGVVKWVPDPDYLDGKTVQRRDLEADAPAPVSEADADALVRRHGLSGALGELDKRYAGREPSRLGMKRIVTPGPEKVRGWRTVLAYMVQHGLVSPEQVRNVLPDADRASWAGYMGRTEALGDWLK